MKFRTKFIIHPRLQYSILGVSILLSLLSAGILYVSFLAYFDQIENNLRAAGIGPNMPMFEYISILKAKAGTMFLGVMGIVTVLNILILTYVTQRIAGPMYRIDKSIEGLLDGSAKSTIKVRKGDFFANTARLLEQVRQRGLK